MKFRRARSAQQNLRPWRLPLLAGSALVGIGLVSFLVVTHSLGGKPTEPPRETVAEAEDGAELAREQEPLLETPVLAPRPVVAAAPEAVPDQGMEDEVLYLAGLAPGLRSSPAGHKEVMHDKPPAPEPALVKTVVEVRGGDTLMGLLTEAGANRNQAHEAITALSEAYDPRDIRPGLKIDVAFRDGTASDAAPELEWLRLSPDVDQEVRVERNSDGFAALTVDRPLDPLDQYAQGRIETSLFAAAEGQGVPYGILVNAIRAMSYQVDFQRDIQPGDRFELLYEGLANEEGEIVKGGDLVYVELGLGNRERAYYRFEDENGIVDFFDANGLSARRGLLRTPIDGARVSSNFGMRKHPIQGYTKLHAGIDFAAPTGTPIYAAGDGVVSRAGRNGGYGNYIKIRHGNGYNTAYAHLNKFATDISPGTRVSQGQVIGYVGSTGNSTGPHLHYEVHVEGEQVDPASVKLPTGRQLDGEEMQRFQTLVEEINQRRREQRRLQVARAEELQPAATCDVESEQEEETSSC